MKSNNFQSTTTPEFISSTLSQAFSEVSEIFDRHQEDINSVSNDIKNLELYLKSRNISLPFFDVYNHSNGYGYKLSWQKLNVESKDFRLLCYCSLYDGFTEETTVVENEKPLIECSLETRLAVYNYLPDFLKSLSAAIKIYHRENSEHILDEEIPF